MTSPNPSSQPNGLRTLAILLMVLGLIGFVAGRLLFPEQVLCLFGSTLITLGGMGLVFYLRGQQPGSSQRQEDNDDLPFIERPAPRSRRPAPHIDRLDDSFEPLLPQQRPLPETQVYLPPEPETLVDAVVLLFEQRGMRVQVEASRAGRTVLHLYQAGERFVVLVIESSAAVGVGEVRGLLALVTASASQGGYLVTAGSITQPAYAWAANYPLRLITGGELDQL